jgi:hypothetical protein
VYFASIRGETIEVSKTRTPDILRKSHRHLESNERAKARDELRHEVEDLVEGEDGEAEKQPRARPPSDDA